MYMYMYISMYIYVSRTYDNLYMFQTKNKFTPILPILLVGDEMQGALAKGKLAEKLTKPKKSKSTNNKASQKSTKVQLSSHHFILLCTYHVVGHCLATKVLLDIRGVWPTK